MSKRLLVTAFLLASCLPTGAAAQPLARDRVPAPLAPWIPWVLDGQEEKLCPALPDGSAVCLWPGRLALRLSASGGTFTQELAADRSLLAPLPGIGAAWPLDVKVDGGTVPVVAKGGRAFVVLAPGAHRVEGRFSWSQLPDSLELPPGVALLDLVVNEKVVPFPGRAENLLLLATDRAAEKEQDSMRIRVFRLLSDGIPLFLETRVEIDVSGKAREVALPNALPAGMAIVAVSGNLPARVDNDGTLRLQVRAGKFGVTLFARVLGQPKELVAPKPPAPWPEQEVWVYRASELLRQTSLSGPPGIDPSRTELPQEWRSLPAYLLSPGTALAIKEERRGEPEAAPDQIALQRRLWLALDGESFTARDAMQGVVGKTTRIDLRAPATLGRAAVGGADQVVTASPETGRPGVELRSTAVAIEADSIVPRKGARLSAVGWSVDVTSLALDLHLPPGWRLLAVPGADRADGAWTSRWTLFAFFFVLVVTIAAARLMGKVTAAIAIATLVLCYREPGAPAIVWFFLVAAAALVAYVKKGALATAVRVFLGVCLLILAVISVPYFVREIRGGLFPAAQSASADAGGGLTQHDALTSMNAVAPSPVVAPETPVAGTNVGSVEAEATAKSPQLAFYSNTLRLDSSASAPVTPAKVAPKAFDADPNAIVQTGSGVPQWTMGAQRIEWSGPVAKDHEVRLLLVPPFANLILAFLRVALVTLLALRIVLFVRPHLPPLSFRPRNAEPTAPEGSAAAAVALLLVMLCAAAPLRAQELPGDELLEELRTRLLRPPPCGTECVSTPLLSLVVRERDLSISAEVHAQAAGAWPLPGPASTWVPRTVQLDGKPAAGIVRRADGFLWLRVTPGVHRVELAGPLGAGDSIALELPSSPRKARANAPGWQVDGVREDGTCDASVQLSRVLKSEGVVSESAESVYEPWFEITRELAIGATWRVETTVRRVTPAGAPAVLRVPMLKGMLTTGAEEVKDGEVVVSMGRDQMETRWSSTLPPVEGEAVKLAAPVGRPWSEIWIVRASPLWQAMTKGIPPVKRQEAGQILAEFRPWPGESLELVFRKPAGVPGQTLTLDGLTLEARPGKRLMETTFTVSARASRSGPLAITLPKGAEVQSLIVDGAKKPVRPEGDTITLTVDPGRHSVAVTWHEKEGMHVVQRVPRVELKQPAVNVLTVLQVPEGRWVLFAGGPRWGPSILFWGELLVLLLAALIAARIPISPLRAWQWLLLALGLAQLPVVAILVVAGWFFVLALRERLDTRNAILHNFLQVGLFGWTLAFLVCLYGAVHQGLLVRPQMQVSGNGSTDTMLRWYTDRIAGETPSAWVASLPLWIYKWLILAWALWLAVSLVKWLGWGFRVYTTGGGWKQVPRRAAAPRPAAPAESMAPEAPTGEVPSVIGDEDPPP